jgi:hypothetical protein
MAFEPKRVLRYFSGLHFYFLSQEKCPVLFMKLSESPCIPLGLLFSSYQVHMLQKPSHPTEKDDISATAVWHSIYKIYSIEVGEWENETK